MQNNNDLKAKIVWGGLVSSLFLYGAILYLTGKLQTVFFPAAFTRPLELMAIAAPILLIFNVFILKSSLSKAQTPEQTLSAYITSWALNESIAIFGFIATFTSPEGNAYFAMVNIFSALVGDFLMLPKPHENKR
jgi:hypothetical protein